MNDIQDSISLTYTASPALFPIPKESSNIPIVQNLANVYLPTELIGELRTGYFFKVLDNSMEPLACIGDIVLVNPNLGLENNDVIALALNGDFLLRFITMNDEAIVLKSFNSSRKLLTESDCFNIYGKVIKYIKSNEFPIQLDKFYFH